MSAEIEEEMDLLSAIFPDECHLDGQRLIFGPVDGLELKLDLPPDFPQGVPRLSSVTGASTADMTALLSRMFLNDTDSHSSSVSDDGEHVHLFEFLLSARDLAAAEAAVREGEDGLETESMVGNKEAALLCTQLPPSLEAAGFTRYGEHCFVHEQENCTVEMEPPDPHNPVGRGSMVLVTATGVGEEELAEFVAMELSVQRYAEFGSQLLEGVRMMRHMASDAADEDNDDDDGGRSAAGTQDDYDERCYAKLPTSEDIQIHPRWDQSLTIDPTRQLHIYTWGDALMKKTALKSRRSQFDINAKPLNGRGGGADTKRNALQDGRIRLNVAASMADDRGLTMLVQTLRKIEDEDLHVISVFCSKGRHRSVSMAVLLKMAYYPQATIEHLTIK
mmetsp:Transcript_54545/g.65650  ORF Transcript_54545/g.65650 Transcript_54545/m.65650 type:complete len:390 (-) Transcript_54545:152-1321(-)